MWRQILPNFQTYSKVFQNKAVESLKPSDDVPPKGVERTCGKIKTECTTWKRRRCIFFVVAYAIGNDVNPVESDNDKS